jgi:site-specific recombinase XerD
LSGSPALIAEFKRHLLLIKNRSDGTADEYESDLKLFFRYITAIRGGINPTSDEFAEIDVSGVDIAFLRSVTREEVYEFLMYTAQVRGNGVKSRARKLSSIKSFYKYLTISMRYFEENPVKNIDTPPAKKNDLPKYLTVDESISLLTAVQNDAESKTKVRDYAIVTLFLNCGMRLSELVGISLSDMDRELHSLRVIGKGKKERIVYLNETCRAVLTDYLKVRAGDAEIKDKNALFLSSRHSRISPKTVQWMIYKYLAAAGLENRHFSTHKLRHTAATLMYQTGKVDVRVLKDILGHEQLNTTQIYTHVSDAGMAKAMEENPLNSIKKKSEK